MNYRCPAQLKQGGQCFRIVRGLYGLYCGTHKHLHFHKKLVETESQIKAQIATLAGETKALKAQVENTKTSVQQQKEELEEHKTEMKEQIAEIYHEGNLVKHQLAEQSHAISSLTEFQSKLNARFERKSIKTIDHEQIREDRIQRYFEINEIDLSFINARYFEHGQSQREKKFAQHRQKLLEASH